MNGDDGGIWQQLMQALPWSLRPQVAYVFKRHHWPQFEVGFYNGSKGVHVVVIPTDQWLNDATIARLCLEAP